MLDLERLEKLLMARLPDWDDVEALIAEVKALRAENAALRLLVGEFEQHVNASVSGTKVGIMTWLDLITRAQRTLEG